MGFERKWWEGRGGLEGLIEIRARPSGLWLVGWEVGGGDWFKAK